MSCHIIDLDTYPRRDHFNYFRSLAYPYVGLTVNTDVTGLVDFCHEQHCSFYLTFMHAAALAADTVPQLRQRIHGDGIIEYDSCGTSHIELLEDQTYRYCTLYHHMPWKKYIESAEKSRKLCRSQSALKESEDVECLYFITSVPWLHYAAFIQPMAGGDDSNPRISWGKYERSEKGQAIMPVTILAHHALVDGVHIAAFYDSLNKNLENWSLSFARC